MQATPSFECSYWHQLFSKSVQHLQHLWSFFKYLWDACSSLWMGSPQVTTNGTQISILSVTRSLICFRSLKSPISSLTIYTSFLICLSGLIMTLTNMNINLFCATTKSDEPRIHKRWFSAHQNHDVCKFFSRSNLILCIRLSKNLQACTTIIDPLLQMFRSKLHRALRSGPFFSILLPIEGLVSGFKRMVFLYLTEVFISIIQGLNVHLMRWWIHVEHTSEFKVLASTCHARLSGCLAN